jgi:IS30 family transposase
MRPTTLDSGRYLTLHERLQIADLERLGYSIRKISLELNTRPRKLLGYRTPKQALHAENRPPTVAFKSLDNRPKQLERCNHY